MAPLPESVIAKMVKAARAGQNDAAIGRALGLNRTTVRSRRVKAGIAASGPIGMSRADARALLPEIHRLNRLGKNDVEIADKIGMDRKRVQYWRTKAGLPAIEQDKTKRRPVVIPAIRDPLYRAAREAVGRAVPYDVADEAISDIILAVLEGQIDESAIKREAPRFVARAFGQWANRHGPASLDEDRDGEGWTRLSATPSRAPDADPRVIELSALAVRLGLNPQQIMGE